MPAHRDPGTVEPGGVGFDGGGLVGLRICQIEGGRGLEILVSEEEAVVVGGGCGHVGGAQPRQGDLLPGPAVVGGGGPVEAVGHVVQGGEQQVVPRPRHPLQEDPLRGLEDDLEPVPAQQQVVDVGGQQRPLGIGRLARRGLHGPVGPQREEQPVPEDGLELRVLRDVQSDQAIPGLQVGVAAEEVLAPEDQVVGALVVDDRRRPESVVLGSGLENRAGFRQGLAPAPLLDDPGIAGPGEGSLSEVGPHPQRVPVLPRHAALRLRQEEAVLDELHGLEVELPHLHRVAASGGEPNHAVPVLRRQAVHAAVRPGHVFGLGELVEVQDGLPVGGVGPVALQGGPPQDPPDVVVVLPEVDDPVAPEAGIGDLLLGVVDGEDLVVELVVLRDRLQRLGGALVLLPGPLQGPFSLHLLQPEIGVLRLRWRFGSRLGSEGERDEKRDEKRDEE